MILHIGFAEWAVAGQYFDLVIHGTAFFDKIPCDRVSEACIAKPM